MFPPEAIKFLKGLEKNNNRDWFQPRKEIFETKLKAPMYDLVESINAELLNFAPEHITEPKRAVYRIYRDTRFSKDKTPYKTHIGAIFPRRGLGKDSGAGYYFHVSSKSVGVACGAYAPGPEELLKIRRFIAENPKLFRATNKLMGPLQGETLQRPPKGFDASHPAIDLIKKKQWYCWTELDLDLATSPRLKAEIAKRFKAMAPMVALLNQPLLAKQA
ncbi:MAG TPA: DUF2461 domain-containing protein [Bryobacteraceae bacterium]|nr:DUF2461 domain-containing protein [Bryobacteraceae bacterium]